jgi:dihydropteroate synthase
MELFGVINASPDSLHTDSIVHDAESTLVRARWLFDNGADHIDLGGQGSTDIAAVVPWEEEWQRLEPIVPVLATILNAADGLQDDAMLAVAAEFGCPIVLPFLNGPDPRHLRHVVGDPVQALLDWFEHSLDRADRFGIRQRCILDPGTGFAPPSWEWADRYRFQKIVYSRLDELRRFGLPIYIALPWRDTPQHAELLEIVVRQNVDYGRCHYPDRVREMERYVAAEEVPES